MSLTDKIKNLIADGKTQQAVDMLQTFLQEKSGGDNQLLNQTLLLEGQYKELQKKVQLGLEDASADINRINFSLLNLCDEAENLVTEADKKAEIAADTEGSKNLSMNPLVIFGVIAAVAILTVVGLLFLNKSGSKAAIGQATTQETETLPLAKPQIVMPKNWNALESVLNVTDRYYGDYRITIKGIKTESFDAERDRLTVNMNLNCLKSISGKCLGNYLKFRLTTAPNTELEPESDRAFDAQSDKTTRDETVSFIVPKSLNSGILDAFYVDKPKSKATTKLMGN
jgi:hypothetical protein